MTAADAETYLRTLLPKDTVIVAVLGRRTRRHYQIVRLLAGPTEPEAPFFDLSPWISAWLDRPGQPHGLYLKPGETAEGIVRTLSYRFFGVWDALSVKYV